MVLKIQGKDKGAERKKELRSEMARGSPHHWYVWLPLKGPPENSSKTIKLYIPQGSAMYYPITCFLKVNFFLNNLQDITRKSDILIEEIASTLKIK